MFPTQFTSASFTWERKELNNILKINSGRDYKQLNSGNIPVYGTGGYMLSVNDKLSDTDAVGIGRKGTIDKPLYLKAPFWTVDTLFYCTSKENSDVKFIYLLFQIINWKRYDESTGVPSLSKNTISNIKTYVPKIKEQDHISKLFFSLDNTLQLHERKCEELALIKKALLQKLFPKNDEVAPEVRYKNFNDAWEQRKLGDFFKKYQNKIFLDDTTKYIQISVRNTGKVEYRTTNYGKDIGRKRQYLVDTKNYPDTLTFTRQTIYEGGIGYIPSSLNGAIVTENMPLLAKNSKIDKNFSKILFKTHLYYHNVIEKNKPIGSAQKALHEKVWLESVVTVPTLLEQQKIGEFFKQLDSLITLHHRKLEKLKQLKKFLLQNMFI